MPAATSWAVLLTSDGNGKYGVTTNRNGTITGGTAQALPTGETGAFDYLPAVIKRCTRTVLAKRATAVIPENQNISFQITVGSDSRGPTYTGTVRYGATSLSGGTAITDPIGETTDVDLMFALNQGERRIKSDFATNG
jgi:hypothetical protein